MKHTRRMARPSAVIAAFGLVLGLPGVAFAGVAHHAIAAEVTVTLTDTKLVVSRTSFEAGPATFVVVNKGQKLHVLTISGPGLKGKRTQKIAAGRTATLTVTLLTGAYMLSDPVGLGTSNVHWLVVTPATVVTSSGSGSVTVPLTATTGMNCD